MLAGGADPTNACTDQGPASCGTTGLCNGGGNCARYDISTECMTSCDATTDHDDAHVLRRLPASALALSVLEPCPSLMCTAASRLRALSRPAVRSA